MCLNRHPGFESPPIRVKNQAWPVNQVPQLPRIEVRRIRTQFDWWGGSAARVKSEALEPEAKRSFG